MSVCMIFILLHKVYRLVDVYTVEVVVIVIVIVKGAHNRNLIAT